ncbi:MAG: prepilin-type N-terminal cleavage/methylation domain-containing protein [Syntrophobacteraceae bacterium]|jgi:type IV pilus assembly protein PilA
MIMKMRESKGFTLVELMIVVAIIGILAAVAVPYYQRYIAKSRLASLVWPGIHVIETNVAAYYSLNASFPASSDLAQIEAEANTTYFSVSMAGTAINFTIKAGATSTNPLYALSGQGLTASVVANTAGAVIGWSYSGQLATNMGLAGIQ